MPINAHPGYIKAEQEYQSAETKEQKIVALKKMVSEAPKHKGAETLRKLLKRKLAKLKYTSEKEKKKAKSGKKGIKKAELQAILIGLTNSGKSSILRTITNAHPKIASYGFTTTESEVGTLNYHGCNIQIIDLPPIASPNFNKSLVNSADVFIIVVEKINEIKEVLEQIKQNKNAKKIIAFNKIDLHDKETQRKISETLKSKRYNHVIISTSTGQGIEKLKEKILLSFNVIRIYTRHPGKRQKLDDVPIILSPNSTLKDVAEKILHGYSKKVKYAKITGPSAKFKEQKIGLKHVVKDKDVVEFFTE
tara:strand:- start:6034 stop:6951 length:918 start_codon:yes stop_codon:yes gene_type:complete